MGSLTHSPLSLLISVSLLPPPNTSVGALSDRPVNPRRVTGKVINIVMLV